MAKHNEDFKLTIVQEYLAGASGYKALAAKYDLDYGTVRNWVARYRLHGEAGLRKKFSHYSAEFKLSVLQRMWQEELSYHQVIALFDLRGGTVVVSTWERQYHEGGLDALKPKPRGRPKTMKRPVAPKSPLPVSKDARTLAALQKENELLRAEVAYLKKLDALVRAAQSVAPKKRKP